MGLVHFESSLSYERVSLKNGRGGGKCWWEKEAVVLSLLWTQLGQLGEEIQNSENCHMGKTCEVTSRGLLSGKAWDRIAALSIRFFRITLLFYLSRVSNPEHTRCSANWVFAISINLSLKCTKYKHICIQNYPHRRTLCRQNKKPTIRSRWDEIKDPSAKKHVFSTLSSSPTDLSQNPSIIM